MEQRPTAPPRKPFWEALKLAWDLGYIIAIPLIGFALLGRWLDRKFDTSPWLLLAGMALAMIISTVALVQKFTKLIKDIQGPSNPDKGSN
jgi:F0F1-type ATP synthase assembly protein I